MATHPFKFYLDFGIRVTINTDNRLITDTTVTKELSVVCKQFGLDAGDIRNILVAGFKSSFLTFHDRAQLVRKVQNEMDEIIRQFAEKGPENGVPAKKAPRSKPPPASKPPAKRA
jgi:adenosine deaminase